MESHTLEMLVISVYLLDYLVISVYPLDYLVISVYLLDYVRIISYLEKVVNKLAFPARDSLHTFNTTYRQVHGFPSFIMCS